MITIDVQEPHCVEVDAARLERAAVATLQDQPVPSNVDLTIVVTGDEQLHQLNKEYLGMDAPTDVLAFPAGHIDPDSGTEYIGDILISVSRAQQQAEAAGHPLIDELQLLVVHGILHLLGYDHVEANQKTRMWAAQREILDHLGLFAIHPPAE